MSNNGNGWKPRKIQPYECADGSTVYVQRPGPEFTLRAGRIPRTFTKSLSEAKGNEEEKPAGLSEEEQEGIVAFARELIVAMVVSPKLKLNPKPDSDELGPDDTGVDFWPLFSYGMSNFFNAKVPVGDGEAEVKDLETFREEPGIRGDSVDSLHVSPNPEQPVGDQGLVDSAGA